MHKLFDRGEKSGEKKSRRSEKKKSSDAGEMASSAQSSSEAVPVRAGPTTGEAGSSDMARDADDDRNGLPTFWPRGQDASATTIDIIAVHGLGADLEGTWQDDDSKRIWLRDFLPSDISDAHILTFGYNSGFAFSGSVSRIDDFARQLLEGLRIRRRRMKTQQNPMVFICHSLGGIVFKKIVDKDSAVLNLPNETITPVEANHISMFKFRSAQMNKYEAISDYVIRLVESAKGSLEQLYERPKQILVNVLRQSGYKHDFIESELNHPHRRTCTWILKSPRFRRWRDEPQAQLLWVHGRPGAGKTILTKFMFHQLVAAASAAPGQDQVNKNITLAYFFSRQDRSRRSRDSMLYEFTAQLLEADATLLSSMPKRFWNDPRGGRSLSAQDCASFICEILSKDTGPNITLVIDGLDEARAESIEQILEFILEIISSDTYAQILQMLVTH